MRRTNIVSRLGTCHRVLTGPLDSSPAACSVFSIQQPEASVKIQNRSRHSSTGNPPTAHLKTPRRPHRPAVLPPVLLSFTILSFRSPPLPSFSHSDPALLVPLHPWKMPRTFPPQGFCTCFLCLGWSSPGQALSSRFVPASAPVYHLQREAERTQGHTLRQSPAQSRCSNKCVSKE